MHELSKFQIVTIVFLMMFVFVVAAIYTNTKEVAESKLNETKSINKQEMRNVMNDRTRVFNQEKAAVDELSQRVDNLENSIQDLQQKSEFNLKCKIQGILNGSSVIPMVEDDAIEEARDNGSEIVMICGY